MKIVKILMILIMLIMKTAVGFNNLLKLEVLKQNSIVASYEQYETLVDKFFYTFANLDCLAFENLGLVSVCKEKPGIHFISQFKVNEDDENCELDHLRLQDIKRQIAHDYNLGEADRSEVVEFSLDGGLGVFLQVEFNYLRGDKFYDPPTIHEISDTIIPVLEIICQEYKQ